MDRLAAFEHLHELFDLSLAPRFCFQIVNSEGEREPILRAELCEHRLCLRLRIDRRMQVLGDREILAAAISAVPASVRLGRVDMLSSHALSCGLRGSAARHSRR